MDEQANFVSSFMSQINKSMRSLGKDMAGMTQLPGQVHKQLKKVFLKSTVIGDWMKKSTFSAGKTAKKWLMSFKQLGGKVSKDLNKKLSKDLDGTLDHFNRSGKKSSGDFARDMTRDLSGVAKSFTREMTDSFRSVFSSAGRLSETFKAALVGGVAGSLSDGLKEGLETQIKSFRDIANERKASLQDIREVNQAIVGVVKTIDKNFVVSLDDERKLTDAMVGAGLKREQLDRTFVESQVRLNNIIDVNMERSRAMFALYKTQGAGALNAYAEALSKGIHYMSTAETEEFAGMIDQKFIDSLQAMGIKFEDVADSLVSLRAAEKKSEITGMFESIAEQMGQVRDIEWQKRMSSLSMLMGKFHVSDDFNEYVNAMTSGDVESAMMMQMKLLKKLGPVMQENGEVYKIVTENLQINDETVKGAMLRGDMFIKTYHEISKAGNQYAQDLEQKVIPLNEKLFNQVRKLPTIEKLMHFFIELGMSPQEMAAYAIIGVQAFNILSSTLGSFFQMLVNVGKPILSSVFWLIGGIGKSAYWLGAKVLKGIIPTVKFFAKSWGAIFGRAGMLDSATLYWWEFKSAMIQAIRVAITAVRPLFTIFNVLVRLASTLTGSTVAGFTAVVAAITAVVALVIRTFQVVYKEWDAVKIFFVNAIADILSPIMGVYSAVEGMFKAIFGFLYEVSGLREVFEWFIKVLVPVMKFLKDQWELIAAYWGPVFSKMWEDLGFAISGVGTAMANWWNKTVAEWRKHMAELELFALNIQKGFLTAQEFWTKDEGKKGVLRAELNLLDKKIEQAKAMSELSSKVAPTTAEQMKQKGAVPTLAQQGIEKWRQTNLAKIETKGEDRRIAEIKKYQAGFTAGPQAPSYIQKLGMDVNMLGTDYTDKIKNFPDTFGQTVSGEIQKGLTDFSSKQISTDGLTVGDMIKTISAKAMSVESMVLKDVGSLKDILLQLAKSAQEKAKQNIGIGAGLNPFGGNAAPPSGAKLPMGLISPIKKENLNPKSWAAYAGDSGTDIAVQKGTPAFSATSGKVVYNEQGHTKWGTSVNVGIDTPGSVLIELDKPITTPSGTYKYAWYTHLSSLSGLKPGDMVKQGDWIGNTGLGNKNAHLHFGLTKARAQNPGDTMPPFELQEYMKQASNAYQYGGMVTAPGTVEVGEYVVPKEEHTSAQREAELISLMNQRGIGSSSNEDLLKAVGFIGSVLITKLDTLIAYERKNYTPDSIVGMNV